MTHVPRQIDLDSQMYGQALEWLDNFRDCWTVKVGRKKEKYIDFKTQENARAFVAAFMHPAPLVFKKKETFDRCVEKHGQRIMDDLELLKNAPDKQDVMNNIWATGVAYNYELFDTICRRIIERAETGEQAFKDFCTNFGCTTYKISQTILSATVPSDLANSTGLPAVRRLLTVNSQADLYVQYVAHKLRGEERPLPPQYRPLPKRCLVEAVELPKRGRSQNSPRNTNPIKKKRIYIPPDSSDEEPMTVKTVNGSKRKRSSSNSPKSVKTKIYDTSMEDNQQNITVLRTSYATVEKPLEDTENVNDTSNSPISGKNKTDDLNIEKHKKKITFLKNVRTPYATVEELLKALQEIALICDSAVELGPETLKHQIGIIKKLASAAIIEASPS